MIDSRIHLPIRNGKLFFAEFSFLEYKNICKMLIPNDVISINNCINLILSKIENTNNLNIIEKFESLIYIRNSILGNEIMLEIDETPVKFLLADACINVFESTDFTYGDCRFTTPSYFTHDNIESIVADYFYSYKDNVLDTYPIDEKLKILNELDVPIIKIVELISQNRDNNTATIMDNSFEINVYDQSILFFLKNIIIQDLMQIYEFEYNITKHLNISGKDLNFYTFPELKININLLSKDQKETNERESGNFNIPE